MSGPRFYKLQVFKPGRSGYAEEYEAQSFLGIVGLFVRVRIENLLRKLGWKG